MHYKNGVVLLLFFVASSWWSYVRCEKRLNEGIVQKWAFDIQEYLLRLASRGMKTEKLQEFYNSASYITEPEKKGSETVASVQRRLGGYFSKKENAVKKLAAEVARLHDEFFSGASPLRNVLFNVTKLNDLHPNFYCDSDIPKMFPSNLQFDMLFKQKVSMEQSSVKIGDQIKRNSKSTLDTVLWSSGLEKLFKENRANDPELRWQYFGSHEGIYRQYPGREWQTNFVGFYKNFDPRLRPWYIASTSGPKDVIIILDCSQSMAGEKFQMARSVAKTILSTLTKQDYVNVICSHSGHYDEVGKYHDYSTSVLSCQKDRLVPASTSHRKDLSEKIDGLETGGTSEFQPAFKMAFKLLSGYTKTGCQSIIIFVTDGLDNDGDQVRCGDGYYTRSGYVPGKQCKYDWTVIWDKVSELNRKMRPKTRIFTYLTVDDGEELPGKLACDNRGYMKKLDNSNNLISQMQGYYNFLASNTYNRAEVTWTAPYLDANGLGLMVTVAVPVVSKLTNKSIGVVGIDATLEEIENVLMSDQWGSVYAFLINNEGEAIFHPLLRPSTELVDDPIFVHVSALEQRDGHPALFNKVLEDMIAGKTGSQYIQDALYGIPKGDFQDGIQFISTPATYHYTSLNGSVYSFAFRFGNGDENYHRPFKAPDISEFPPPAVDYFANLQAYNSSYIRKFLPTAFEDMNVQYNLPKYPNNYVTYDHSTVMLAPKVYCNPNEYLFSGNFSVNAFTAHEFINSGKYAGCNGGKFRGDVRPDVEITGLMTSIWKKRNMAANSILKDVRWTYVGTRRGVFRSYPGHRSRRDYDLTKRPWYLRALYNPSKTTVSNAYMDASGIGKIITISQAVFESVPTDMSGVDCSSPRNRFGGCSCLVDSECLSRYCRKDSDGHKRCAGNRVEAVAALDIQYSDFHQKVYELMKTSDDKRSCGKKYTCPDGLHECQTRCYLFDNLANLVTDPDFVTASNYDEREYQRVSFGHKEGSIMKLLLQEYKFFTQTRNIDFQGSCSVSPYAPKVTLEGIIKTPEQEDEYYENKGPVPPFHNEFGCIQDVIGYNALPATLSARNVMTGNSSGPCSSGNFFLTALQKMNLYLLVVEDWTQYRQSFFYNFNCHINREVFDAGAFRIVNGTCAHIDTSSSLNGNKKCPIIKDINIPCSYNSCKKIDVSVRVIFLLFLLLQVVLWGL